jgi:hypothetical protein
VEGIMNFRDAYVNELFNTTDVVVDGMKSAWQDFDTATGLVSKLKQLPSLLPSVDPIVAYDEEYETATMNASTVLPPAQHHHQHKQQSEFPSNHYSNAASDLTHQQQKPQRNRPTSLLGGFVRSLAQSVTLPQEDPSIYQEWQQHQPSLVPPTGDARTTIRRDVSNTVPRLYNVETPKESRNLLNNAAPEFETTIPHLYNISDDEPSDLAVKMVEAPQHISRIVMEFNDDNQTSAGMHDIPTKSKVTTSNISIVEKERECDPNQEQLSRDGWDDDIDIVDIDDSYNSTNDDTKINASVTDQISAKETPDQLPTKQHSIVDSPPNGVYDPVTGILPTRTRYRNPIGGSRNLQYI